MQKEIKLVFHNQGLRSYIEVNLCSECPRQDDKGCCGFYSPVFYSSDFAYLLKNEPGLIDRILQLNNITILDASVTINNSIDGDSYRCYFHNKDGGCLLAQHLRESVCRHFVCPGIAWEQEEKLRSWKEFFDHLSDYEIELNNRIAARLQEKDLTLRDTSKREQFFEELLAIFEQETSILPEFFNKQPAQEEFIIIREIIYGQDWPL
ncbi:MAG TPA: hypothetical protein GXX58_04260 [Gelria sp.]|nr:hypothetical protein [Gelria sp.]